MKIIFEPGINPTPTGSNLRSQSHLLGTEFSEARHQLLLDNRYLPASDKAARTARNRNRQRQVFVGSSTLVEEAFYWFLTAPALVYVAYLAFGF
jgi:hypothetical protein